MRCDSRELLLYAVTDRSWLEDQSLASQVERALKGGATFIQLREKELPVDGFLQEAREIKTLCQKYRVPFVINDNVEIAMAVGADGVHVGQSDMETGNVRRLIGGNRILGVSVQNLEQALLAQRRGADYLGVGAVFPTGSKQDAEEVSHEVLGEICRKVTIPVVAIGGIHRHNIMQLAGSGISGVAVISAVFAERDIEKATLELKKAAEMMVSL